MHGWYHLIADDSSALALDAAEHSAQLTNRNKGFVLHTLACLYAELGRTMEARDLLLKDMELEGMEEPDSDVWYGFGRIAEQYGLSEAAMAAYRRVEMPEDRISLPESTYTLAQRRIAVMLSGSGSESR